MFFSFLQLNTTFFQTHPSSLATKNQRASFVALAWFLIICVNVTMAFSFFEDEVLPLENGNNTNQLACVVERLGSNTKMRVLSGCLCKPQSIISYTELSYDIYIFQTT